MPDTTTMRRSYLVQRLKAPRTGRSAAVGEVFAFGGGMRNGGLSDEAMGLLRGIFSFDYMGAAEFEFGAVPEALTLIAKHADELTAFGMAVPLASVPPNWRAKDAVAPDGDGHLWVLCRHDQGNEVVARITAWATSEREGLKEPTNLSGALRPYHEWDGDVRGWLELDNGFFFFTDHEMWQGTCRLFGVETDG